MQFALLLGVFCLQHDSAECFGIVHGQVGENFAVDFDSGFVKGTHQFGIGKTFEASCGIDTLNPKGAEIAFFGFAVAVSVGKTFFPGILGNGPHIFTRAIVSAGKFQDFFSSCS